MGCLGDLTHSSESAIVPHEEVMVLQPLAILILRELLHNVGLCLRWSGSPDTHEVCPWRCHLCFQN